MRHGVLLVFTLTLAISFLAVYISVSEMHANAGEKATAKAVASQGKAQKKGQSKNSSGDPELGKKIVVSQCKLCHELETDKKKLGPSLKGLFKREAMANGKPVTEENVLEVINKGGNGMPAYQELLSPQEKASVIAFLKTL